MRNTGVKVSGWVMIEVRGVTASRSLLQPSMHSKSKSVEKNAQEVDMQGNRMDIFVMVKHEQAFAFPLPLWERGSGIRDPGSR
ncbi:hypothetical protein AGMMS50256_19290 [Betaproteobacteria bacterium]|nr:hypothetical protein AGMMS50256_19290 [Betaproteobacteria bacterium]